jgi:Skp family chaperone for outer membrane proteins
MKTLSLLLASVFIGGSLRADDLKIAKFNLKRVFDECQRTKELQAEIDSRRNNSHHDWPPIVDEIHGLSKSIGELTAVVNASKIGTRDRRDAERDLKIAKLEKDSLERKLADTERANAEQEEADAKRQRWAILQEIWAEAAKLAAARNYTLVLPEGSPEEIGYFASFPAPMGEDVTDVLIDRENKFWRQNKEAR